MKKVLVVLENDMEISKNRNSRSFYFMEDFKEENPEAEIIQLTNLSNRDRNEVGRALAKATHIACQTVFIGRSDSQLKQFAKVIAEFPTKDIIISCYDLQYEIENILEEKEIYAIRHHNIYSMDRYEENHEKLDFSHIIEPYDAAVKALQKYNDEAKDRVIGKVKILDCNGMGKAFQGLPIGEVVDRLDMSATDENHHRGVWIQGNGEPIKLINDSRFKEYEIVTEDKAEKIIIDFSLKPSDSQLALVQRICEKPEEYVNPETMICDEFGIERRGNRAVIRSIIHS